MFNLKIAPRIEKIIPVAITSLNLSEKWHKIPVTGSEKLLGCQGSLTVAIPAVFSAYLSQKGYHRTLLCTGSY